MSEQERGVSFPLVDGRRSTSATGRGVVADALRPVDPVGASAAARETSWRSGYLPHFRRLVEAGLPSREDALSLARSGLGSLGDRLVYVDGPAELALHDALARPVPARLRTEEVFGTSEPERELSLPYRGQRLRGPAVRDQLDRWVEAGVVEPSVGAAVREVLAHPEWLVLPGWTVVAFGAGSEMGPVRSLLRWGGTVAAVDLPRPDLWRRLLDDAGARAGRLLVPSRPGPGPLADRAGTDLVADLAAPAQWVSDLEGPLVLGSYVYADGATNVRVCAAVDAVSESVRTARPVDDVALAFLATPTDVFAVPGDAVAASVTAYEQRKVSRMLRVPLRTLSGGRLLRRSYLPGEAPGLNDSVVLQQGPNYLLAKRLQRWRATVAREEGTLVSFKVAPPTRTRSVVKNRALAAAYAGAHRFGIEVFDPGTSNTLMAALLVHDLMSGSRGTSPDAVHPWQDEAYGAAHGGLWRAAYDPRSALGLAALLGAASAR